MLPFTYMVLVLGHLQVLRSCIVTKSTCSLKTPTVLILVTLRDLRTCFIVMQITGIYTACHKDSENVPKRYILT